MKINGYENLNFVKWAGGKGHLINQQYLPKKIERYFEPFIGGGAVFFYIMQKYKPKFPCISDINQNLIITYWASRNDVKAEFNNCIYIKKIIEKISRNLEIKKR